jgi:hypothetical protein
MKSPLVVQKEFNTVASYWLRELDRYTEEQFSYSPELDSWSIGQVYEHLTTGTFRFHLNHINNCLKGKSGGGNKTFPGRIVFFLGSIPKRKIKVPPSPEYTPKQPVGVASVRGNLIKLIEEMKALIPSLETSDRNQKSRHPFLGALNAEEWYRLIEMHFRHHLQQKERLDKSLGLNS